MSYCKSAVKIQFLHRSLFVPLKKKRKKMKKLQLILVLKAIITDQTSKEPTDTIFFFLQRCRQFYILDTIYFYLSFFSFFFGKKQRF